MALAPSCIAVLTDQFTGESSDRYADAERAFQQLTDAYERLYYTGLLHERRSKLQLRTGRPARPAHTVTVLLEDAMRNYEEAERIRPTGNDDAILRWNRCARLLHSKLDSEWHREVGIEMGEQIPRHHFSLHAFRVLRVAGSAGPLPFNNR